MTTRLANVRASRLLLGLAVVLCAVATTALFITAATGRGPLASLDGDIARTLHSSARSHAAFATTARGVSLVGAPIVFDVLAGLAALYLAVRRRVLDAVSIVIAVAGSGLISTVFKLVVGRPRPHFADPLATAAGLSFPSGHATSSIVATGVLLAILLPRRAMLRDAVGLAAVTFVVLIGLSRLVLGVHYFSDVLGGWLLGGLWLALCLWYRARRVQQTQDPVLLRCV